MTPVTWTIDLISPFPYLSLPRLPEIERRRPIRVRPVLFGALLQHFKHLGPAEIPLKRLHTYRLAAFTAATQGQPFRFPPVHPFNPLPMMRILTALDGDMAAVRRALALVWGEGRDPTSPETLMAVAGASSPADLEALIERTGAKEKLRTATAAASVEGIFGVPTLTIDGEHFWGADALGMAIAFLDDPALFRSGELKRAGEVPVGVERKR
ncbi:MAG TPA: DsbA family protein [Hyphomicrobiaceae bacterium]|nr:DsbA family protein [Hyphomicrobiaceae bacterium]